jgi:hypothetical protein
MFGAVALFVVLLVAMLYLAFVRFRNPPQPRAAPAPVGVHRVAEHSLAWAAADAPLRLAGDAVHAAGGGHV